ncbi:hypothetical protein SprV_0501913800 [Sparganum proliferum]
MLLVVLCCLIVRLKACSWFRDNVQCPRRDDAFSLKDVAEQLVNKITTFQSSTQHKGVSITDFKMQIEPKASVSECFFLRDILPASYIQYACALQFPSIAITLSHSEEFFNGHPYQISFAMSTKLRNVSAKVIIDFSYWNTQETRPNIIRLSGVEICNVSIDVSTGMSGNPQWRKVSESQINYF